MLQKANVEKNTRKQEDASIYTIIGKRRRRSRRKAIAIGLVGDGDSRAARAAPPSPSLASSSLSTLRARRKRASERVSELLLVSAERGRRFIRARAC